MAMPSKKNAPKPTEQKPWATIATIRWNGKGQVSILTTGEEFLVLTKAVHDQFLMELIATLNPEVDPRRVLRTLRSETKGIQARAAWNATLTEAAASAATSLSGYVVELSEDGETQFVKKSAQDFWALF